MIRFIPIVVALSLLIAPCSATAEYTYGYLELFEFAELESRLTRPETSGGQPIRMHSQLVDGGVLLEIVDSDITMFQGDDLRVLTDRTSGRYGVGLRLGDIELVASPNDPARDQMQRAYRVSAARIGGELGSGNVIQRDDIQLDISRTYHYLSRIPGTNPPRFTLESLPPLVEKSADWKAEIDHDDPNGIRFELTLNEIEMSGRDSVRGTSLPVGIPRFESGSETYVGTLVHDQAKAFLWRDRHDNPFVALLHLGRRVPRYSQPRGIFGIQTDIIRVEGVSFDSHAIESLPKPSGLDIISGDVSVFLAKSRLRRHVPQRTPTLEKAQGGAAIYGFSELSTKPELALRSQSVMKGNPAEPELLETSSSAPTFRMPRLYRRDFFGFLYQLDGHDEHEVWLTRERDRAFSSVAADHDWFSENGLSDDANPEWSYVAGETFRLISSITETEQTNIVEVDFFVQIHEDSESAQSFRVTYETLASDSVRYSAEEIGFVISTSPTTHYLVFNTLVGADGVYIEWRY